jgi:hypothetical protein
MVKTRKLRMDRSALGNQGQVVLLYARLYGNGDRGSSFSRNRKIERSIIVAKAQETHNQRSGSVVMRSDDPAE